MKKVESILVPKLEKMTRLSDFVPGKFESIPTKKGMKKAITNRLVKVNGKIGHTGDHINGGEIIELFAAKAKKTLFVSATVDVLYEDEYLAVVNKPSGLVVSGNLRRTLENKLPRILKKSTQKDALNEPQVIHRLDQPTSGLVLVGKTRSTIILLNKLFEDRKVTKTYLAITIGKGQKVGSINTPIKTKSAETNYSETAKIPSDKYEGLNLIEVMPITGRRHQIRIHMAEVGNPILGDSRYGIEGKISKGNGLYLHASSLQFEHPVTTEDIQVTCPVPEKFIKIFPDLAK